MPADVATVDGRRIEDPPRTLLSEIGRAARIFAPLERALEESQPAGVELSTAEAHRFLTEFAPALREQGFGVADPKWWGGSGAQLGLLLDIETEDSPPAAAARRDGGDGAESPVFGLHALVDYRWRIAVGNRTLTIEEFEKLATSRSPLVKVGGQWVEIKKDKLASIRKVFDESGSGQMSLAEAMRLAYASDEEDLGAQILGVRASGWAGELIGEEQDSLETDRRIEMIEQPPDLAGDLRAYQRSGLSWLAFLDRLGLGGCLADDMGLGKTIQLIALLLYERGKAAEPPAPTLVVAPTSVVGNWRREAAKFAGNLRTIVHHGPERLTGEPFAERAREADLVITTYALAHRDFETLSGVHWRRVCLDEAQNIKNPSSKQSQAVRGLPADRRVALTGTPVENRLTELWSIMEFLNPGYLGSAARFRRKFSLPVERRRDAHRTRQLRQLVQPFVLRRLKTDPTVVPDLPKKVETKEHAHLTPEQSALYEQSVSEMLGEVERSEGVRRRGIVLATLIKLKQICNHPAQLLKDWSPQAGRPPKASRSGKATRLVQMLDEVVAAGDQALVFTQFRKMGEILAAMLRHDLDRDVLLLHGGTPQAAREQMIERFQKADGSAPIFILSLKAGGVGMNLTAASHVFHYDRWWNPAVENQATDRAHRIGQDKTVHVHKFIVSGTLEERIDEMLEQKMELAETIIGSGEEWLTELSTTELREMLRLRPADIEEAVA
jgi:SNF2 family DNA or RNA helicase